jgi:electron transfer flavoprotein alpha/beta subunit
MTIVVLLRAIHDPELAQGITGSSYRLDEGSVDAIVLGLEARHAGIGERLVGIAMGPDEWEEAVREGLSLGLDEATRTWGPEASKADMPAHARAGAALPSARTIIAGG